MPLKTLGGLDGARRAPAALATAFAAACALVAAAPVWSQDDDPADAAEPSDDTLQFTDEALEILGEGDEGEESDAGLTLPDVAAPTGPLAIIEDWGFENAIWDSFQVTDGVLRVTGPQGWLRSRRPYDDFRLRAEFRFLTNDADSGLFVRASGAGFTTGGWPAESYEVELRNPARASDLPPVGGLIRHEAPEGETRFDPEAAERLSRGVGDWQTIVVEVVGEQLRVFLNDEIVTEADGIAIPSGYIGIQSQTDALEFRSIIVEEL